MEAGNRAPVDTATATLPRMINAEATDVDGNWEERLLILL